MRARQALAAAALLLAAGCGQEGPPVAPERRAPQPVSDLTAVVVDGGIELRWTNPAHRADATRLRQLAVARLFRTEDAGPGEPRPALRSGRRVAGYAQVAEVRAGDLAMPPGETSMAGRRVDLVDRRDLTAGRRYTYVVVTEDVQGRPSPPSLRLSATYIAPPAAPAPPAAEPGHREVRLRWPPVTLLTDGAPVHGEVTYEVLRATSPDAPLAVVTAAPLAAPAFVDRGLDNDHPYRYAVRALRRDAGTLARSATSAPVTATPADTTPPGPPRRLVAVPAGPRVLLSWQPSPDADVVRYVVHRASQGGPFVRIGSVRAPLVVFTDPDVGPGTYRYVVTAEDAAAHPNESAPSNEEHVSVP